MGMALLIAAVASVAVPSAASAPATPPATIGQAVEQAVASCPTAPADGTITVCGQSQAEKARRYGLPEQDSPFDPNGSVDSVSRERHRLMDGDGASPNAAYGSCNAVGYAGGTGCTIAKIRAHQEQKGW